MRAAAALTGLTALTLLDISASTAQAQSFQGAYAGIHAGVRWDSGNVNTPAYFGDTHGDPAPAQNYSLSSISPLLGAHLGFNALFGPAFLVGVEGDFDAAENLKSLQTNCLNCDGGTVITSADVLEQGTIRGRLGFVTGSTLFYGTGGLALADVKWTSTLQGCCDAPFMVSQEQVHAGWVAGAGFETFVGPNLIFRTEYLHEDFGSFSVPLADYVENTGTVSLKADKLRAGLSFKF